MAVRLIRALAIAAVAGLMVVASAAGGNQAGTEETSPPPPPPPPPPAQPTKTKVGMTFSEPRSVARIKIGNSPYTYFHVIACNPRSGACGWTNPEGQLRRAAREFCQQKGTTDPLSDKNLHLRVGGQIRPFAGEDPARRATTRRTDAWEPSVDITPTWVRE